MPGNAAQTGYVERVRSRPQNERTATFFWWVASMSLVVGVVLVVLHTRTSFIGYVFFGAALVDLIVGAVYWRRKR
jgi:hypothetical protein